MQILKTTKPYKCKLCKKSIESEHKVKIWCGLGTPRYYHLNCYHQIVINILIGYKEDVKIFSERLKKFKKLQKEMKEEERVLKKQMIYEKL